MGRNRTREETQVQAFLLHIKSNSDKLMNYFLGVYFIIGLLLANYYDTWLIGFGVGSLSLAGYYCAKYMLPDSDLYQYVLSAVFGIFMAQFIYQMHGMFEMHFFAFVGSAILITYQNWKLQIPLALVVVIHHAVFGYLQFIGFDQIFFTQLSYMTLETFIIHGILATVIFFLCGLWAHNFKNFSKKYIAQSFKIGKLQEADKQKEAIIQSEKRYSIVSENSFLGISWASSTGNLINANDTFCRMMGYSKEELMNKHFSEFSHPEDVTRDLPFIKKMEIGEIDNYQTEKRFITRDNKIIWAELNLTSIKNADENYRIAIIQDITPRKLAEERLENTLRELEKRVEERTRDISITNQALRSEIEERIQLTRDLEIKNKDITDSINYAQRIQRSFLPKEDKFTHSFRDYFILNLPKDVVSGDFYWLEDVRTTPGEGPGNKVSVIAAVDCTGHGIPGALVSIVGNTLLNQTIKNVDVNTPADALNFLNRELPKNLKKQSDEDEIRDGMDMVVCAFDFNSGKLHFSGANNSIYIISDNKLTLVHGDRQPISASESEIKKEFTNYTFDIKADDCVYLLTDGYADQFGGDKGKKFKSKHLQELLLANAHLSMKEQKMVLSEALKKWKGDMEQVDDILIIGIKV